MIFGDWNIPDTGNSFVIKFGTSAQQFNVDMIQMANNLGIPLTEVASYQPFWDMRDNFYHEPSIYRGNYYYLGSGGTNFRLKSGEVRTVYLLFAADEGHPTGITWFHWNAYGVLDGWRFKLGSGHYFPDTGNFFVGYETDQSRMQVTYSRAKQGAVGKIIS